MKSYYSTAGIAAAYLICTAHGYQVATDEEKTLSDYEKLRSVTEQDPIRDEYYHDSYPDENPALKNGQQFNEPKVPHVGRPVSLAYQFKTMLNEIQSLPPSYADAHKAKLSQYITIAASELGVEAVELSLGEDEPIFMGLIMEMRDLLRDKEHLYRQILDLSAEMKMHLSQVEDPSSGEQEWFSIKRDELKELLSQFKNLITELSFLEGEFQEVLTFPSEEPSEEPSKEPEHLSKRQEQRIDCPKETEEVLTTFLDESGEKVSEYIYTEDVSTEEVEDLAENESLAIQEACEQGGVMKATGCIIL